jgi:acyl-coenzyme A thioesterase PaaI-like protein
MDKLQFLNDRQLPFAKVLGLKFTAASETGVKAEMVVKPELCTRPDILHGGAVMAFADTLGAAADRAQPARGQGHDDDREQDQFRRACAARQPR